MALQFTNNTIRAVSARLSALREQVDVGGYLSCLTPDCCNPAMVTENDKLLLNMMAVIEYLATGYLPDSTPNAYCPCPYLACYIGDVGLRDFIVVE